MDIGSILSSSGFNLYGAGQRPEGSSTPNIEDMMQHLIEDKDKDGSGTLDGAELCISEDLFNQIDTNGDGQLNAEELVEVAKQIREAMGPPPGMPPMQGFGSDEEDDSEQTILDILQQDGEKRPTRIDLML